MTTCTAHTSTVSRAFTGKNKRKKNYNIRSGLSYRLLGHRMVLIGNFSPRSDHSLKTEI